MGKKHKNCIIPDKMSKTVYLTDEINFFDLLKQMDEVTGCDFDDWVIRPFGNMMENSGAMFLFIK